MAVMECKVEGDDSSTRAYWYRNDELLMEDVEKNTVLVRWPVCHYLIERIIYVYNIIAPLTSTYQYIWSLYSASTLSELQVYE